MTGIEPVTRARAQRRGNACKHRRDFLGGATNGGAGSRGVLDEQSRLSLGDGRKCPIHGFTNAQHGRVTITVRCGAWMKADATDAQCGRALEFLGQTGSGACPLLCVGRSAIENVRRVDNDMLRFDSGALEGFTEARNPIRLHGNLVVVELGNGAEDL